MDNNSEGRQRAHRTPLVLPLLGENLEVLRTDVDGVGSLMEGMTIVPSVNLVLSLPSVETTPTSTALVTGGGVPSFSTRSGGPRGDMSVLLAQMVLPLLGEDLEVLRTDVDGFGSLMEGMTMCPLYVRFSLCPRLW